MTIAPRVLLVDDDPEFLQRVREALEAARMDVRTAPDGEAALEFLSREGAMVQAAIVDLDLPSMSGFDLIREMQSHYRDVAIMAVTGIYEGPYLDIARNVGAKIVRRKTNADW